MIALSPLTDCRHVCAEGMGFDPDVPVMRLVRVSRSEVGWPSLDLCDLGFCHIYPGTVWCTVSFWDNVCVPAPKRMGLRKMKKVGPGGK